MLSNQKNLMAELVVVASLQSLPPCQDFKVGMLVFQPFNEMKLKTSKFKVLAF